MQVASCHDIKGKFEMNFETNLTLSIQGLESEAFSLIFMLSIHWSPRFLVYYCYIYLLRIKNHSMIVKRHSD